VSNSVLTIETFIDPTFGENAYVLSGQKESGVVGWVVDPGFPPQVDQLLEYVRASGIRIEKIVLTHGHADHIAGLDHVRAVWPGAEVLLAVEDQPMLSDPQLNLSAPFGFHLALRTEADGGLAPGTELSLGDLKFLVLDTSGHSPGGRSLYCAQAGVVLAGDALFAGSIGRTDLPGADHHQLIRNIRENLLILPETTLVYSGHGPATTIGIERKSNPFVSD
jgi:hydroxyacylglutathione hydrolase